MAAYGQIPNGMSYEECVDILGAQGSPAGDRPSGLGKIGEDGARIEIIVSCYTWFSPENGATIFLGFNDNKVTTKQMQTGNTAMGSGGR